MVAKAWQVGVDHGHDLAGGCSTGFGTPDHAPKHLTVKHQGLGRACDQGGACARRVEAGRQHAVVEQQAVRAAWPETKPLFYRISSVDSVEGGWEIEDSVVFAGALKEIGVDIVDCSSGGIGGPATAIRLPRQYGFQVPFSAQIRREAGVSTMAVGLIVEPAHAEEILQSGDADLIAIAREALYNPFWPHHAAKALGAGRRWDAWPEQYGWWLSRRERFMGQ